MPDINTLKHVKVTSQINKKAQLSPEKTHYSIYKVDNFHLI